MKCNMDCFNCIYDDCINDYVQIRDAEKEHERYIKNKDKVLMKAKSKYAERKALGICTDCGKHKAMSGKTMCCDCLTKMRNRISKKRRQQGILSREEYGYLGLCKVCGKKKMIDGHKVCEDCLPKLRENVKKATETGARREIFKEMNNTHFKLQEVKRNNEVYKR